MRPHRFPASGQTACGYRQGRYHTGHHLECFLALQKEGSLCLYTLHGLQQVLSPKSDCNTLTSLPIFTQSQALVKLPRSGLNACPALLCGAAGPNHAAKSTRKTPICKNAIIYVPCTADLGRQSFPDIARTSSQFLERAFNLFSCQAERTRNQGCTSNNADGALACNKTFHQGKKKKWW